MPDKHIPMTMQIIDNMVSIDERKRKYTDRQILKILVLLKIFNISYRSSGIFLRNHGEYMRMIGVREIPSFQTLSRRARSFDIHEISSDIAMAYSMGTIAAIDSFMIHTCRYSTAVRRRYWNNYKDPDSGWSYGRKCHVSMDVDSLMIMEWMITKGNIHDSMVSHDLIDSVRYFKYILADSAYDTSGIYDYVFENTHSISVIDTNTRRGIVTDRLSVNRKIGVDLRKEHGSLYSLRWEIERTFSILEEIMHCENIWHVKNRDYDNAVGLRILAYNLMLLSNIRMGENPREIMKIVSC